MVAHIEKILKQLVCKVSEVKRAAGKIWAEQCHHVWYHTMHEESLLSCKFWDNVRPAQLSWADLTNNLPAGHPGHIPNHYFMEERIEKGLCNPWDKDWRPVPDSNSD